MGLTSQAAAEEPCKRNKDGSITCSEQGMKTLTDGVIDLRAKVKTLQAKNAAILLDKEESQRLLLKCQDAMMTSMPPDPTRVLSGYVLGLVSVGMLTTGILLDMPMDVRASVVGVGLLGALAGGVMLAP